MIIYKINNNINGKIYIGQTIRTFQERFNGYKNEIKFAKKTRPIIYALRKYGIENFTFEVIDYADTKEELDDKERYYIKFYNSADRNFGYNIELGGNGPGKHSEETKSKIRESQLGELNHMFGKKGSLNATSKSVIDLTTGKVYDSASQAAEELKLNFSHVCAVARGSRGSTGGHVFRYYKNNNIQQPESITRIKDKKTLNAVLPEFKHLI
jgi:hypothetical protein